ncbi:MAG: tyrosine-type recombinase/integrase [Pseudomonadota bacterium]
MNRASKYLLATGTLSLIAGATASHAQLAQNTQRDRRRIYLKMQADRGAGMMRDLQARHISADLSPLDPAPANNRLKCWRALCAFAVDRGVIEDNPASLVKRRRTKTAGRRRLFPEDIERVRRHWPIGSDQRAGFEIMYWTGARSVDARRLGPGMVRDGMIEFQPQKTGGPASCFWTTDLPAWAQPLSDDYALLQEAISALPDRETYLATTAGKIRSEKGMINRINEALSQAGLDDDLKAHGLRKTRASELTEIGAQALKIMTWTGHESPKEVEGYITEANRRRAMRCENR